jgi:uncharacterized protein
MSNERMQIGYIVGGGLKENLRARLTVPAREVQEGAFVVVEDGDWFYYGLVTDLQLGATDPRFADEQSEKRFPESLAALLHGQTLYTNLEILPALMVHSPEIGEPLFDHPVPIKTVPAHHAEVRMASQGDIAEIFGDPLKKGNFVIGNTREQGHPVCIDLDKLVQRSSGIFGATGTGKSFLTRIILAGLIHSDVAGALIFDMHNEYGPDVNDSDRNVTIPGLKTKFLAKVRLVGLGRGSDFRGRAPDFNLEIAERDIETADVEMLTRELNLKETTPTTLAALEREFRLDWFHAFKSMRYGATIEDEDGKKIPAPDSVAAWANQAGINVAAAEGLHSKLGRVFNREYIVERPGADTIGEIVKALENKQHVVLSFGRFENDLDYLLAANILTRRIRAAWEQKTNEYLRTGEAVKKPRPLVIVVEEAHKLLNREMAAQTAFSTIAREMRKYSVTLLIIDQRPSQIYDEVMSQLGTRISGWLGDDLDIQAVLSGLAAKDSLRGMLARLQPKEEVLLLGWGVPMPIPVRSRRYDEAFWADLFGKDLRKKDESTILKELGF